MPNSKDNNFCFDDIKQFDQEFLKFIDSLIASNQAILRIINLQQGTAFARYISQICNDPSTSNFMIEMAINELIINAIEHGLLKIDYVTKAKLLQENNWQAYISERLSNLNKDQFISIKGTFLESCGELQVQIVDPGKGFNLLEYEKQFTLINENSLTPPKYGRGTILIKNALSACSLKYFLENEDVNGDLQ